MKKKEKIIPKNFNNAARQVSSTESSRFGAVAFVENSGMYDENNEDLAVLTLDALRNAFAVINSGDDDEMDGHFSQLPVGALSENTASATGIESESSEIGADNISPATWSSAEYDENPLSTSSDSCLKRIEMATDDKSNDDCCQLVCSEVNLNPKTILEAMLFVGDQSNRPLLQTQVAEKMRNVTAKEIDEWADELNKHYDEVGAPYFITKSDAGMRLVLRHEFESVFAKFQGKTRETTLSQSVIDTLAMIAYKQPITLDDLQRIRKQPCGAILSQLVRRGLLVTEWEIRDNKRVAIYKTTERFLTLFHLDSISDLPMVEEL
ncbi:MAG: SMC-Scp complex subunit ScpB [Thermoguttaceae bacterium]